MIGYIEGDLFKIYEDRVLLLANHIGYEIILPGSAMNSLKEKRTGDQASFFIYYHQTDRQPKPVLIGFTTEEEKNFFQRFITVEDLGPMKAVKAMTVPVEDIARAIEQKNAAELQRLKGIGKRTAMKIVAALSGTMGRFMSGAAEEPAETGPSPLRTDFSDQVYDVLVNRLGHKPADAKKMIGDAWKRNPAISSPEELFDEVYHT